MTVIETLFSAVLKAVGALANNENPFKRLKRGPFNPKITLGINLN